MVMPELSSITTVYVYATGHSIWNTLGSVLQLIHFKGGIIGVGIYSIEVGQGYKVFDSHARDVYGNSHSEGTCVVGNTIRA